MTTLGLFDDPDAVRPVALALYDYQLEAVERIRQMIRQGVTRILVVAPVGAGKSCLFSYVLARIVEKGKRGLVCAHRVELIKQNRAALIAAGISPNQVGVMMASVGRANPYAAIQVASVDTLRARLPPELTEAGIVAGDPVAAVVDAARRRTMPRADVVVVDEAHRSLSPTYVRVARAYPNAVHLGFTASPWRMDNQSFREMYDAILVVADVPDLIARGYLARPRVFTHPRVPDLSKVRVRANGDYDEEQLAAVMDQQILIGDIVDHWLLHAGGARTFCFASSVPHSRHLAEEFRRRGVPAEHVDGGTDPAERAAVLARLKSGETRVATNYGLFCLDEQTEILTTRGWLGIDSLTDTDDVATWKAGRIRFDRPRRVIRRPRAPGEAMVASAGTARDVRVTANHRMLFRSHGARRFAKHRADALVGRRGEMPACGIAAPRALKAPQPAGIDARGVARRVRSSTYDFITKLGMTRVAARAEAKRRVARKESLRRLDPHELTDDHCRFIGFWIGDGSVRKLPTGGLEYTASQSTAYPKIIAWLDALVGRVGLDSTRHVRPPSKTVANAKPYVSWSFGRGTGGGPQERRGLFAIEPYLDKAGSPLWWGFDERQFAAFLEGYWLADGLHGDGASRPTGLQINTTVKTLADTLQAIATCRGYRCIVRTSDAATRRNPRHARSYRMTFTKGGRVPLVWYPLRAESDWRAERVWCVETEDGAIVTRRNGRVLVTGNCEGTDEPKVKCIVMARPTLSLTLYVQCVGRAMRRVRPWPDVTTCILLDHAGCARRHGLPDDAREYSLDGKPPREGGQTKECACGRTLPRNAQTCDGCGFVFGAPREPGEGGALPDSLDGELEEVDASERKKKREARAVSTLRRRIQGLAIEADRERGWPDGWSNRMVVIQYGKGRPDMSTTELQEVLRWFESGDFAKRYPVTPFAPTSGSPPATP